MPKFEAILPLALFFVYYSLTLKGKLETRKALISLTFSIVATEIITAFAAGKFMTFLD